mgnify:FL=1
MQLPQPAPLGSALGLIPNEEFGGESVRLQPEDVFIFFTDGAFESANAEGEEFGMERLEKVLRTHLYDEVDTILDAVLSEIANFLDKDTVPDDVCLVAVEIKTSALKKEP